MRRIAVLNQKGGVGKTTTVANLSACLASLGKRVLTIDLDPQANLTIHFGVDVPESGRSVYELMSGDCDLPDAVMQTQTPGLDMIPATIDLAGFEVEFSHSDARHTLLKSAISPIIEDYDFIFVDCPPSLGLLTVNALTAVKEVFIALQTEFFALQGVSRLLQTCRLISGRMNPELDITGVLACMFDPRTTLARAVLADIRKYFGGKVFKTLIRKNIRLAEAPSFGVPIIDYDKKCYGSMDYMSLANEVLGSPPELPPPLPGTAAAPEAPAAAAAREPAQTEVTDECPTPVPAFRPPEAERKSGKSMGKAVSQARLPIVLERARTRRSRPRTILQELLRRGGKQRRAWH